MLMHVIRSGVAVVRKSTSHGGNASVLSDTGTAELMAYTALGIESTASPKSHITKRSAWLAINAVFVHRRASALL